MDLRGSLARFAAGRPHVLLVPAIGGADARLAVEAELARRCWPTAASPADADVVVVAGTAGPRLGEIVEALWAQVPVPRARTQITDPQATSAALDLAAAELADVAQQSAPATEARRSSPHPSAAHQGHTEPPHGHPGGDGAPEHHSADHTALNGEQLDPQASGHEHTGTGGAPGGGDGGHHGHGAAMPLPGGLPMAELGDDRDGLMLDRLHLPLGPALPDWPAGLVLHVVLQGDVVQHAEAELLDVDAEAIGTEEVGTDGSFGHRPTRHGGAVTRGDEARRRAAGELDSLGRLLAVAGWADPAARARRLRDDLLAGAGVAVCRGRARPLLAQLRRSRTLRWLVRGINTGGIDLNGRLAARLDALEAALAELDEAAAPAASHGDEHTGGSDTRGTLRELDELASLLVGAEFAAARLVVAALDPDTDAIAAAWRRARRG